jgi:hypothetical protein
VIRTSAGKILSVCARIEKGISRASDRAPRALNFAPISRSRVSALGAIVRDLNFSREDAIWSQRERMPSNYFRDRQNIFLIAPDPQENRGDITQKIR